MVPLARFLTMLVFFLGLTFEGAAQDDYQQGYVVTNTNDTLHGMVRDRKTGAFGEIYDKIRFKSKGRKKRLAPNDILGYKIGNTEFKSLFLENELTFLKVASEGYVSHYKYELQEQGEQLVIDIDYLQKGKNSSLTRATQGLLGLKRRRLANLFSDCHELVEKMQNKEFKYVFEVVDFYNGWKSNQ